MEIPDTSLLAGIAGALVGASHVLTGPDHIAAVLPLALSAREEGRRVGLAWGLGHSTGLLLLGLLTWLLNAAVVVERWSQGAEQLVGVMLVVFGGWTLVRGGMSRSNHRSSPASTASSVGAESETSAPARTTQKTVGSAFGFGVLHGVAGVGHMIGVIPALVLQPWNALVYLAAFITGSTGAMMAFTNMVGSWAPSLPKHRRLALRISGVVACVIGGVWLVQSLPHS